MIFIPKIGQWLCIDCNSERIYFENLRANLEINNEELSVFFDKMINNDGISLSREGAKCNGFTISAKILNQMNISNETQEKFYELCKYYGGYCDCEIVFNTKPLFFDGN